MAFVGDSRDFDLEANEILMESLRGSDLLIDDEGIVRDDDLDIYKYMVQGHWADSGIGGDKQSSTSTLHHRQISFEDDTAPAADDSINISELEASKDEVSFDRRDEITNRHKSNQGRTPKYLDSRESTLDKPLDRNNELPAQRDQQNLGDQLSRNFNQRQLFSEDYYRQLHDLGVLVDGVDLSRDSLNEFDETSSHMVLDDDNAHGRSKESQDLIGEYLESERRREQEEDDGTGEMGGGDTERDGSNFSKRDLGDPYSQGSSRTIGSYDFPDHDEDYYDMNISQSLGSNDHYPVQRMVNEQAGHNRETVGRGQLQRIPQKNQTDTSFGHDGFSKRVADRNNISNQGTHRTDSKTIWTESAQIGSRPSSRASSSSTKQPTTEDTATRMLLNKSTSQESLFGKRQLKQSSDEKSHQKRILPKPSSTESSQSFKVKSRGINNWLGPVKPDHTSGLKAPQLDHDGEAATAEASLADVSIHTEESAKELSDRLTQEAQKRKQATELVQQLQKDYGSLLTKYALAELTIDQMRLGARINIHTGSPTPGQARSATMSPVQGRQAKVVSLHQSMRQGVLMGSPDLAGHTSRGTGTDHTGERSLTASGGQRSQSQPDLHRGTLNLLLDGQETGSESSIETAKAELMVQVAHMEEKLESFCTLLDGGQLNLQDQEVMFEQIKGDHDKVRRTYLQVKDEYNVLRRSGALNLESVNFDPNKELEGHLFKLGMRFDDVHERVQGHMRDKSKHRQPFQSENNWEMEEERKRGASLKNALTDVHGATAVTASQQKGQGGSVTTKFELRVQQLRQEYNDCMDMFRKLKYTVSTAEVERQIEHIVVTLSDICTEMPDMFRLSPEIEARRTKMLQENRLDLNERKQSVWEKLQKREQEKRQPRKSPVSQVLRGSGSGIQHSPSDSKAPVVQQSSNSSDEGSVRVRLDGSSLGSILPNRMGHQPHSHINSAMDWSPFHSHTTDNSPQRVDNKEYSSVPTDRPHTRSGTPATDTSFSDSISRGHDSSNPSLPRPQRHEHSRKNATLPQRSDSGGVNGLHQTLISNQDSQNQNSSNGGDGAAASNNLMDALAALPGPGKMKQMTKQRAADDADSGFIGSMVGSGVGVHPAQQQQTLRLARTANETDNHTDTSTQAVGEPGTPQGESKGGSEDKLENFRGQITLTHGEDSYDGEEDTTETLESEDSWQRSEAVHHRSQGAVEEGDSEGTSKESNEATMEGSYIEGSDISTPRAADQSQSRSLDKVNAGSGTTSADSVKSGSLIKNSIGSSQIEQPLSRQSPSKEEVHMAISRAETSTITNQSLSQVSTVSEADDELRHLNKTKFYTARSSENLQQMSDREGSTNQKRLKSVLTSSRPSGQGSPTTDLFHNRERQGSVGSKRNRIELGRQKEHEHKREKGHLRQGKVVPLLEQQRKQGTHASSLPSDPRNLNTASQDNEFEDRSTGSEVDSSITRTSSISSSHRLKALQEEIERLKEGVARANERSNHPPPPPPIYHHPAPPPAPPQQRQEPDFYDPFEDPYGFMRMPRRRANSFSGGREREWDEWYWTLPQNRQYDGGDIPLGYAAADAYADLPVNVNAPRPEGTTRENIKNRLRQRRVGQRQARDGEPRDSVTTAEGRYISANQEPRLPASQQPRGSELTNEQSPAMYYVPPQYSVPGMRQQMPTPGLVKVPVGSKMSSSTVRTGRTPGGPWYQIRRSPQPMTSNFADRGSTLANGYSHTQSQEDVSRWGQSGPRYSPWARSQTNPAVAPGTATQICPLCAGSGSHTHTTNAQMDHPYLRHPLFLHPAHRDATPSRRSRRQSRSPTNAGRNSSGHSHPRYRVREYSQLSDSGDEEDEETLNRRSRSLSRGRSRTRSRGRSSSRPYRQQSNSPSDHFGDQEASLDHSLSLSVDIGRLTQKMLGTISTELRRTKHKPEFGSSFW